MSRNIDRRVVRKMPPPYTQTPNLALNLPPDGDQGWGQAIRDNFTVLDTRVASFFVGPNAPVPTPSGLYVWVQTGLGAAGADMAIWVEDGT
jgi:hypothetical protein